MSVPILTVDRDYVLRKERLMNDKFIRIWERQSLLLRDADPSDRAKQAFCLDRIKTGGDRWHEACQRARLPQSEFSYKLYKMHRSGENFTDTILRCHLSTLSAVFHNYANLVPEFKALPVGDQKQLLEHNTRIFCQYFLGRYFYGGCAFRQSQWLLLCQVLLPN